MAVEDLVDDFWRDALRSKVGGPEGQAKWNAFINGLKDRVANFPQEAQDEVFMRAAKHNAARIALARKSLDALRVELGLPAENIPLVEAAADTLVRATVWHGVGALFRWIR
ncbi:hypothetical protein [Bradyrhizobium sp. DOA1]|uniref:hypothetical protein n=1 Tax=Bradyrhizobium sp. DOA1 TaxID=1126616 RepID=UPI00077CAC57|nr:hypothetical protein [Bradyrhizobium sp. DOA1]KYH01704.1 hypothetical protein SE91_27345 [Bradyrhizobium sp. DOA1]